MPKLLCDLRSSSLGMNTTLNIIIPEQITDDITTVYLLHGMYGDHTSWMCGTSIGRYANKRKIAVIMPSAENSFYCNMKYGCRYYDYIAEELIEFTRKLFLLSHSREKTFVAGLSMGGYGAFKIALRRPEIFGAAASLSGCLDIHTSVNYCDWPEIAVCNWGEDFKTCVKGTDDDLFHLIESFPADMPKPRLYSTCGTEDILHAENTAFRDFMVGRGFDYSYNEGPGKHNWTFWDKWIDRAFEFMMPTEK